VPRRLACVAIALLVASCSSSAPVVRVFVANTADDTVSVIDGALDREVQIIAVGSSPQGIALATAKPLVAVANGGVSTVALIDPIALAVAGEPVKVGRRPEGVAFSGDGALLFASSLVDSSVAVIDVATRTPGRDPIAFAKQPQHMTTTTDGRLLVTMHDEAGEVALVDPSGGTVLDGARAAVVTERMRCRIALLLGLWTSVAVAAGSTSRPIPFSDHLVRSAIEFLASDRLAGRDNDTPGSELAQAWLIRRLRRAGKGLDTSGLKDEAYRQRFVADGLVGANLLAVVPGRELPDEYVLVGAHYDHLGTRSDASGHCRSRGTPGGDVCNGATDNASGTAIVLAIGRALRKHPPRRSVILALWDEEEDGLLGSLYYVNHPLVPLAKTIACVNFDIQGSDLLPSLAGTSFAVGPETGTTLTDIVRSAALGEVFRTLPISYIFGQLRSDYANFVNAHVPTVFFGDSTNGCYHTTGDDLDVVDWAKLAKQGRIALRTTMALADATERPTFVPPNPSLASYDDALTLQQVFGTAIADFALFPPHDQTRLLAVRDTIDQIVADGPAAFDVGDVATLLAAALDGIDAIVDLGCRKP
jgi:YVTN family beta-propeller protein